LYAGIEIVILLKYSSEERSKYLGKPKNLFSIYAQRWHHLCDALLAVKDHQHTTKKKLTPFRSFISFGRF